MNFFKIVCLTGGLLGGLLPTAQSQSGSKAATSTPADENTEVLEYRSAPSKSWDLLHTTLAVSFDWDSRYLNGQAKLQLKPYFYEQQYLMLDAKGMNIKSISARDLALTYEYDGWQIIIDLGEVFTRTDTLELTIGYVAKPYELEPWGNEPIQDNRGLYFINHDGSENQKPRQIWTQGETESNSCWFPTLDRPNEKCTQRMEITVQNKFRTLSNGLLVEQINLPSGQRTDVWEMDQPHSPYLFMLAVGEFEVIPDQWNDLPLAYWMEPGYGQYAKDIFKNTPEMLTFFSDVFGYNYPWKKYDQIVVRDYVSGAMENTTASLFYEELNSDRRSLIDYDYDDIIAHELVHQWFGDLVTCESWANLTLNEGFASYGEYLWNQYKYGQDQADYSFLIEQDDYLEKIGDTPKNLIRYYYQYDDDMFDEHSYNKGAAVLHMLRNYVGDEAFFASLKKYLSDNAYQAVELAQLRLAFEEVTGEDLNWFFDQWFFFAGHPQLEVRHTFENDTLTMTVAQVQSTDEVPIFQLPVFIDIWEGEDVYSYPVKIENAYETFQFPMTQAPEVVIFDSERQLLSEIDHPKSEQEYYGQFMKDGSLYSRVETMDSLYHFKDKKLVDQILRAAFEDPFYRIRQYALEFLMDKEIKLKNYETEVIKLLSDSSSHVRSYAYMYLGSTDFKTYKSAFLKALDDESYLVVSSVIAQYVRHEETLPAAFLEAQKDETNLNMVVTLASYYNQQKEAASLDWFATKIDQLDGNTLFYFIQIYAEKLLSASDEERLKTVPVFEKIARNDSNYLARFSAFQALVLMSEIEGVPARIKDIRAHETDPRLLELYERI